LQTDGGLSVVLDAVFGDDVKLLSDQSVLSFGTNSDITVTHVEDVGLTITNVIADTDNRPIRFQLKSEENAIVAADVIATIEFAAGDSDGTDGAVVAAGIHAIAEGTFASDANATKLVFTTGVSETAAVGATEKMTLSSAGVLSSAGGSTHADDVKAKFGTGNDLEIYHDGSNSRIKDSGTGVLVLQGNEVHINNAASDENMIVAVQDGAVSLYHNNVAKLATAAGGISVTGTAVLSAGSNSFAHLDGTTHSDGGSRDIGTNYTNSAAFDKVIYVSVSNTDANALMIVTLDGDTIFLGAGATGDANYHIGATIIWPAGKVVNITMNGTPTLSRWVEYA